MGVPKFYRWLSERYPQVNQEVASQDVPPTDNLYLDMNGIIHNCTHGDGDSVHLDESEMMRKIFNYIEVLVSIIRPQKLVFLAVDGVAPRAKVNQQRSRRFKAGKERIELEAAARRRGEEVPSEPFDSNCITPGTPFMARLEKHLCFFVRRKMAEDPLWQQPQVILSGPCVPGEGEHKVMEYLRWAKRDKRFEPNQRHCLYGLDADLIMLGLVTHEPHFYLLREIVTYGSVGRGRPTRAVLENPCADNFTLLHIGLLREYWALEFGELSQDDFKVDIERVIDDMILVCMLVGNDFLPSLPTLDIAEGALDSLINTYKELLPKMKGYLHDAGTLNPERFEVLLQSLGERERDVLEARAVDANLREKKNGRGRSGTSNNNNKRAAGGLAALQPSAASGPTMMSHEARALILAGENEEDGLSLWKERYYAVKLEAPSPAEQRQVTVEYVKGINWVLQYYYRGVVSWDWYYPYHFAPMASEVKALHRLPELNFNYGSPFLPYQQLLAVMPASSYKVLPAAYHELMLSPTSPLRTPVDYFPSEFPVDLEGKRADWEGIVLIPFIDERILLRAESGINFARVSQEERERNNHGPVFTFQFDRESTETLFCQSTLPKYFSSVVASKSRLVMVSPPPPFPMNEKGFCAKLSKGTTTGLGNPIGFPTFQTLKLGSRLDTVGVNVFGQPSKKESLVVELANLASLQNLKPSIDIQKIAKVILGQRCYVDWPFLKESTICAVSNTSGRYDSGGFTPHVDETWETEAECRIEHYLVKMGVDVGESPFFVHVRKCIDLVRMLDGSIEKRFSDEETMHPLQITLRQNPFEKEAKNRALSSEMKAMQGLKPGSLVMYTGHSYYGAAAIVLSGDGVDGKMNGSGTSSGKLRLQLTPLPPSEGTNATISKRIMGKFQPRYFAEFNIARKLGIGFRTLGALNSTIVALDSDGNKLSLGLCLKSKGQCAVVPDYCRRVPGEKVSYEYSLTALKVFETYKQRFPWVFTAIEREYKREYTARDFFGDKIDGDEADKQLHAAARWLKKLPLARRPMVKEDARFIPEESVRALQQAILPFSGTIPPVHLENVAPGLVLTPFDPTAPKPYVLTKGQFDLGDRVASVGGHPKVPPFSSRGTIVGIHPNGAMEAVFDEKFPEGGDLYGRCLPGYGSILPSACLINLSKPCHLEQGSSVQPTAVAYTNATTQPIAQDHNRKPAQKKAKKQPDGRTPSSKRGDVPQAAPKQAAVVNPPPPQRPQALPQRGTALKGAGDHLLQLLQKGSNNNAHDGESAPNKNSAAALSHKAEPRTVEAQAGQEIMQMLQAASLEGALASSSSNAKAKPSTDAAASQSKTGGGGDLESFWKNLQAQHTKEAKVHRSQRSKGGNR